MKILRSLGSFVGGFLVLNVLVSVWAFGLVPVIWPELAAGADGRPVFPPRSHVAFKVEVAVNLAVAVVAGYVCAVIAGRSEKWHVAALGGVMLAFSLAYAFGFAGKEYAAAKPALAHAGTAIGLVAGLGMGGWLRLRQKSSGASVP